MSACKITVISTREPERLGYHTSGNPIGLSNEQESLTVGEPA